MIIVRRFQFLFVLMWLAIASYAQHNISVSAPRQVSAGENFRIAYTINTQDVEDFRAANIPSGLELIAGPYTSRQSSYQIINGHTSGSSSITFTYTLYADKKGVYTIGGARAKVGGRTISSRSIKISVSGSAKRGGGVPNMHDEESQMQSAGTRITGNDLFVKVTASKRRVREQEPILLTYKVYTQVDLTQLDGKMPDLTGFHTQEIKLPQQKSFHLERVNGRNYRCVTWSQYVMYPQMTGKLKIPNITFKGIVVQQNRSVDPFEAFFNGGSGYVEVKRNIVAPGLEIQVDPLPNKPAGFSGGVGHFNITAQANHREVKAGDPITLRVVISGNGNLKLIKQPIVEFPKDFDKYDPKITDKTSLTSNGIEGNMIYDYLVVPRNQGEYTIPPVSLIFYDTSTNSYKTIKTNPIKISVAKGKGGKGAVVDYGSDVIDDVLPLRRGEVNLDKFGDFFFGSSSYWLCIATPIVLFVILLVVYRKRAIDNADIVKVKGRKANKIATKRLRSAYRLMLARKQDLFYDEVLKALWGYVSDKLNMPAEQLTRDNISEKLQALDIKESTIGKFISALDECEFERYAPGDAAGNMNKTYESAMVAITDIEESLKMRKKNVKENAGRGLMLALLLLLSAGSFAVTKDNADAEYLKGNYQQAIADYNEILKQGVNPDIYNNLGNCYYRTGNITQAVIAYERALMLSPGDNGIRQNLQFVRSKTIDKIVPENEMFFVTWYRSLVNLMSVDGWAAVSVVAVFVGLMLLLAYLFGQSLMLRKCGFFGVLVSFFVLLASFVFAYQQKQQFLNRSGAVVVAPSINVKQTPSDSGNDVFVVHEGTRLDITDKSMKGWVAVRVADGREGWVRTSKIEEI